jgi:hypothetical protein
VASAPAAEVGKAQLARAVPDTAERVSASLVMTSTQQVLGNYFRFYAFQFQHERLRSEDVPVDRVGIGVIESFREDSALTPRTTPEGTLEFLENRMVYTSSLLQLRILS